MKSSTPQQSNFGIPFPSSFLNPTDCAQIGEAIWLLLWCIDKVTLETKDPQTGVIYGNVLRGTPCKDKQIAKDLGICDKTARKYRLRLTEAGYIETTRTPYGHSIKVVNSRKWMHKGVHKEERKEQKGNSLPEERKEQKGNSPRTEGNERAVEKGTIGVPERNNWGTRTEQKGKYKEDLAVDLAVDSTKSTLQYNAVSSLPLPADSQIIAATQVDEDSKSSGHDTPNSSLSDTERRISDLEDRGYDYETACQMVGGR